MIVIDSSSSFADLTYGRELAIGNHDRVTIDIMAHAISPLTMVSILMIADFHCESHNAEVYLRPSSPDNLIDAMATDPVI